ncbi:hypothetical protein Smp_180620 [Schistosoma mansoni]|uniref:hypothetical protein n=1 Tax=Schistosoma mansoni TaxID=6183 RepID=UPI00022C82BA|nr:hypothetical protein Smp_180620 [Schistosoma mansoni]|eukprot:XP_018645248.1 hypothetical protein Smp_180620 [Schistosoma mansoni]
MFLFIALMLVLVSVFQNPYMEVHGGSGSRLSVGLGGHLADRLHNASVELAKDKVNKTLMDKYGRR